MRLWRWIIPLVVVGLAASATAAMAQERGGQPGRVELAIAPVGGMFFTDGSKNNEGPTFGQYGTGVSATYNGWRHFGLEAELGSGIGLQQHLGLPIDRDTAPPSSVSYQGNVVAYPWGARHGWAPYATGGLGAMTMLKRAGLTSDADTFFDANFGGGAKYYVNRRWGLRGDYRFFWINANDQASEFFARTNDRYGHRIEGGVVLNLGRK